ncbi:Crp/Fnr family transcriptional regulator [Pseudomonadota bacterium]
MKVDMEWLEEHVLLCKLSEDDRKMIEGLFEVASYLPGDVIVSEGAPGGKLYLLRSGRAEISCLSGGKRVPIATADADSLFGEMSFLTGDVASATVTADENCVVYELSRGGYSELMLKNQDLVYALFAHMLVHTAGVIRRMNEGHVAHQHDTASPA